MANDEVFATVVSMCVLLFFSKFVSYFLCRTGKDGYIQIDGDAALHGQSKGRSRMVNTSGSLYLGEKHSDANIRDLKIAQTQRRNKHASYTHHVTISACRSVYWTIKGLPTYWEAKH